MKKVLFTVLALAALVLVSCSEKKSTENNPFMSEYANEYGIPPFDKITYGDYKPAVEAGIEQQNAEIDSIIKNTAEPNFENVILALDNSGRILDKVSRLFNALSSSDNTPEMQKLSEDLLPMLTAQSDGMYMNDSLFAKVKAVFDNADKLGLDPIQKRLTEKYYKEFVRNGALLSAADKDSLKAINSKLGKYKLKFGNNVMHDMDNCTWSAREYSLSPLDRERYRLCAARLNEFGIKPLGYTGQITIRPLLPLSSPRTWKLHLSWAKFLASIGMGDAFLLDDNRYPMHPLDVKNAGTGANLDAKYVTKLYREVKKDYPDFRMAFCPPFYWGPDSPASYPEPREPYLKSVGEFLDPEISVAWTGGSVKTKNVTREKAEWYSNLVGRKPILCQNSNCIGKHAYTQYGADSTGFKESHSPDTFDFVAGFNQNMTHYGEGSMVASAMDWCWNPDAHDGTTSVRRALDMFEGPGVYDVIAKGTDEISYFDKYEWGKPRIELLGEDLAMLERRLAAGEEAWSNAMKIAKNGGEFMCGYKDRGLLYARNLVAARRNPSESLLKEREAVNASVSFAKNEAGFDDARGDEFIPGALLFGGTYAENMGDWTKRGLRNVKFLFVGKTLSGGFSCEPFPPPKPFVMNICARSCDAKEKGTYEVEVNGRVIWRGEAFIPYYYTNIEVEIPVDAIKRVNTFKIRNASPPNDDFRKALFHYVVIKKGVDK